MEDVIKANKYRGAFADLMIKIYEEKIEEGYNGTEWLILNLNTDDYMYQHEATTGLEITKEIFDCDGTDFNQAMKDWAHFTANGFYRKYKMNWWIFGNSALVHLHQLHKDKYSVYLDLMAWIYDKSRRKRPVSNNK